jgi:hypothetical protein
MCKKMVSKSFGQNGMSNGLGKNHGQTVRAVVINNKMKKEHAPTFVQYIKYP